MFHALHTFNYSARRPLRRRFTEYNSCNHHPIILLLTNCPGAENDALPAKIVILVTMNVQQKDARQRILCHHIFTTV